MDYFKLLQDEAFDELVQTAVPVANTDPFAALALLRLCLSKNTLFLVCEDKTFDILEQYVGIGNPFAQYVYARWLICTRPDEDAISHALPLLEKAYKAGIPDAGAALSMSWAYGDYGQVDRKKAQEYLEEALKCGAMLAYWYRIRALNGGNWFTEKDPEKALQLCNELIAKDEAAGFPPNGAWFALRGDALEQIKDRMAALPDWQKAVELGFVPAYFWVAYTIGHENGDDLLHAEEYYNKLEEGSDHFDTDSMYMLALYDLGAEEDLPEDPEERAEAIRLFIEAMEDTAELGSIFAMLDLAEIYHDGKYGIEKDMDKAWKYLEMAARQDDEDAYERMWAMVEDGDIKGDEETKDWLALKGARCGSELLTKEVVKAYKAGRLQAYTNEITEYYLPLYPNEEPSKAADEKVSVSVSTDERPPLQATGEALENYWKTCVQYCEQAEHILQEQDDPSPIAAMANEVIIYGKWLGQFEHMLGKAYAVTKRMAECIYEHPRLLLRLKEVEMEILDYIQAVEQHDLGIADDLREEIEELKANIRAADEGRWNDIKTGRMLKSDPVEWTAEYEAVIDEADHEAYAHLQNESRGMGFCFAYWHEKAAALARRGIEWRNPHILNPRVMFD